MIFIKDCEAYAYFGAHWKKRKLVLFVFLQTVTPGQDVSIDYAVSDDSDEITTVGFYFNDVIGNSRYLSIDNPGGIPLNGTITQTVPGSWVNGTYRLSEVYVYDAAGNRSSYQRNGNIYKYPQGATGPTSHTLNFSAADFTVAMAPDAPIAVTAKAAGDLAGRGPGGRRLGERVPGHRLHHHQLPGRDHRDRRWECDHRHRDRPDQRHRLHLHRGRHQRHRRLGGQSALQRGRGRPRPRGADGCRRGPWGPQATLTWDAAAGNGSPVTGYTITSSPDGITKTVDGNATTGTVTGLTNGTGYTFTVVATNAIGDSVASDPSNEVTPAGVPGAPTGVAATRGDQQATLTWDAAAGNGSPVTGYTITSSRTGSPRPSRGTRPPAP